VVKAYDAIAFPAIPTKCTSPATGGEREDHKNFPKFPTIPTKCASSATEEGERPTLCSKLKYLHMYLYVYVYISEKDFSSYNPFQVYLQNA
jgi:hypothetical protein